MEQYTYLREKERQLIARLETLGFTIGLTLKVLAKIIQARAELVKELHIEQL